MLLQTTLTLNDLADLIEARIVFQSWSDAAARNLRRESEARRSSKRRGR